MQATAFQQILDITTQESQKLAERFTRIAASSAPSTDADVAGAISLLASRQAQLAAILRELLR